MLQKIGLLAIAISCVWLPATAPAAPVVVFPLQELGAGRNEVNLPFTRELTKKLAAGGNEITSHETIIAFMANNRIRTVGYLETFHISRLREDLGAAFVLLGTVSQQKERPMPSLGLTLQLVRTSDARTVWSYVGHVSVGDERRMLGIGEPRSVADLQQLLLDDILSRWPWEIVREVLQTGVVSIDSITLGPALVRPGGEVSARVRMRSAWLPGRAPQAFFKAEDQLHAARISADGSTYEAAWIAGEKDGRYPVTLLLEWPLYGRSETALLGSFLVDGKPPLFEIELRGTQLYQGIPTFRDELVIFPQLLVRKPLERWRLAFHDAGGNLLGADEGAGNLPERFIWQGRRGDGDMVEDGTFEVVIEAWDKAGNKAQASRQVGLSRSMPGVELSVARSGQEMTVDLEQTGKVPLAYWRMEMWSKEGKILSEAEGQELPAKIGIELPDADQDPEIEGYLVVRDALGNVTRKKVEDLFQLSAPPAAAAVKEEKTAGISQTWVDEF
jgi:TolB-like protein